MHDRYGNPLKVGDVVVLRGKITSASTGDQSKQTYCNIIVEADVAMNRDLETGATISPYILSLNAGQVELVSASQLKLSPTIQ